MTAAIENSPAPAIEPDATSPPPEHRVERARTLALRLAHAENSLLTLTSGQVDSIIDPNGKIYLLRPAQEHLRQSEKRLQALIDSTPDVITVVNRGGAILLQSRAVTRVLGFDAQELVGTRIFDLIHADDLPTAYSAFFNVIEGLRESTIARFRHRCRDGTYRTIEATVGKLPDSSPASVVCILRPVTSPARSHESPAPSLVSAAPRDSEESTEIELAQINAADATAMDGPIILRTLRSLAETFRIPLTLFYRDRFSLREIAKLLELPIETVMFRLSRGKALLRQQLEKLRTQAVAPPLHIAEPAGNEVSDGSVKRPAEMTDRQPAGVDRAAFVDAQILFSALQSLEEGLLQALTLFYRDRLSYHEIAEVLMVPVLTVTSRLAQAEALLRLRPSPLAEVSPHFVPLED